MTTFADVPRPTPDASKHGARFTMDIGRPEGVEYDRLGRNLTARQVQLTRYDAALLEPGDCGDCLCCDGILTLDGATVTAAAAGLTRPRRACQMLGMIDASTQMPPAGRP